MKKTILLLTVSLLSALGGSAQTTSTLGLPGFNNSYGPFFTSEFTNGFASGNLNQLLLNLQADLSQILPVVGAANDSFDFTPASANATGTAGIGSTATTTTSGTTLVTTSALPGVRALSLGTSLGQDLSSASALGGRANLVVPTALGSGVSTAIAPIAGNNGGNNGVVSGTVDTGQGSAAFTSRRDVLRALIILQDDVEKMLPLVNALNGGNETTLNTVFTNNLGTVTRSTTLTPTGR